MTSKAGHLLKDGTPVMVCFNCSKPGHFFCEYRKPPKATLYRHIWAAHIAALLDDEDQQDLGDKPILEPDAEPEDSELVSSQQKEYVNLETYYNEYYTCDSESDDEGLYALTDYNNNVGQRSNYPK